MNNEKIEEVLMNYPDFEFINCYELEEVIDNNNTLLKFIQDRIAEQEVVRYKVAINYLAEHDYSLRKALSIANEHGYTLDNLSSEVLATVLHQQKLSEQLFELVSDLELRDE